ncbi:MAG: thiamine-phosphate kinase [Gammaproteobacteria bacterium]|nr:thiamine-phosphate kinase [Gammaproteobacteria bacterium]MXW44593.1 thiamine-phosphate kinase [Gammaproteobacteria bacterium]MYD02290.1 thiamine-phosphate kinase [Gammaproteobacteria bacterium]MYI24754.1 thiamine-phosphate kinase [Gammaproteobacteria bacterium]
MPTEREDRLIEALFARHSANGDDVLIGPGDDAALLRCPPGEQLLITTDTLNEGVHFPAGMPARSVGHRALAVSLSDLAAMAARPLWAVVTLSVPAADEDWLGGFADGLYALADEHGLRVVGGDFVRGPLSITVTAHGSAREDAVLRRDGAGAGDGIWVSGFLGEAAAGLEILQQRLGKPLGGRASPPSGKARTPSHPGRRGESVEETLVRRFCYPQPRIELGRRLSGIATACMDLSDGLLTDLPRLLRHSGLQGLVETENLPISDALRDFAGPDDSRRLALAGGDDYELCLTVPEENEEQLEALADDLQLTRIGDANEGEGLVLTRGGRYWEPPDSGFRHFS